ncbi:MAG: YdiU family protein [Burkholderiales bacterium]|nr:YdiU family protein [Burkholderiales bacterium]
MMRSTLAQTEPPVEIPPPDQTATLRDLCDIAFDNSFVRELRADPLPDNIPRQVRNASYTRVTPSAVRAPQILAWSDAVGELLGIAAPDSHTGPVADVLGGSRVLPGMAPYAARYGGHQFGHWAGQLGDGRAITLAEVICPDGLRRELQLKGAGRTPYSRTADGRAVLRSSVREFMCSEAMHYLGVPTTRALSLVGTGEMVVRDMFYDGNPAAEPGAVVCRVAPTFVRFGHVEILAAQKEFELLKQLADYVIRTHFPALASTPAPEIYAEWFEEICRRTAMMVAHWMRVGFVHGVMNTDNMSILGLTIDYGPYGWLEGFDPNWTPNTTDAEGRRYRYGSQPQIAHWNLTRLASALHPLISDEAALVRGLGVFEATFNRTARQMLATKLGWTEISLPDDEALLAELMDVLLQVETDMTLFFRGLADVPMAVLVDNAALVAPLAKAFYDQDAVAGLAGERLANWLRQYCQRVRRDDVPDATRRATMNQANPKYVLRNYLAQQAIDALAAGDARVLDRLMKVLQRPYDDQPEHDDLAARRPEWARHKAGCSALSCSS